MEIYPKPSSREAVSVASELGKLYGTLDLPERDTPIPLFLIISGSGPTDRDGNSAMLRKKNDSLKMLGGWLTSFGGAALRYDKRGIGESKDAAGDVSTVTFENMISDARLWIDMMKDDPRFSTIHIIGHSEGSLVGICAAGAGDVESFISIAGAGRPISIILREQFEGQPGFIRRKAEPILAELEKGNRVDRVPFLLKKAFAPDLQPYLLSWMKYDPPAELAKLDIPCLVLQGTTDIQTSHVDARFLADAGSTCTLAFVEGMNHILKDAPAAKMKNIRTYMKENLPLSNNLVEELRVFFENQSLLP